MESFFSKHPVIGSSGGLLVITSPAQSKWEY